MLRSGGGAVASQWMEVRVVARSDNRADAVKSGRGARAFTLMELLVVVAIIGVLMALLLGVGRAVLSSARRQATQDTIAILDSALSAYMDDNDGLPPIFVQVPLPAPPPNQFEIWPMGDVRNMTFSMPSAAGSGKLPGFQMMNSTGLFLFEAQKYPRVKAIIDKLPPKFVVRQDVDGLTGGQPELMTVLDGWGRPIRFVHPTMDGRIEGANPNAAVTLAMNPNLRIAEAPTPPGCEAADIRRNRKAAAASPTQAEQQADSDGGQCVGNRPYFYSGGEDGLVGYSFDDTDRNADNVYSVKPRLPRP